MLRGGEPARGRRLHLRLGLNYTLGVWLATMGVHQHSSPLNTGLGDAFWVINF